MTSRPKNSGEKNTFFNSSSFILAAVAALLMLTGYASANAQQNPAKPRHTLEGFKNNYATSVNKSASDFFRWQYERLTNDVPKAPQTPARTVVPGVAFIHSNAKALAMQPAITWVGHATMLVHAKGLNMLSDPIFL